MYRIKIKIDGILIHAYIKGIEGKEKCAQLIRRKNGEGFIDTAVKILISVVIGALLLAGLYTLFKDTVLPSVTERIKALFDYSG